MKLEDRFDSLFQFTQERYWPRVDWRFIKGQALAESNLRTTVRSPVGAAGLLQLMPATFLEACPPDLRERPIDDPEANLAAGVLYLKDQFDHFPEVEDPLERLRFSVASYNCGRGYVNAALALYRAREGAPSGASVVHPYTWEAVHPLLARAEVRGRRPDFSQVWKYVQRVWENWEALTAHGPLKRNPSPISTD